jgi:hypothetical protein
MLRAAAVIVLLSAWAACAETLPPPGSGRALYGDLQRMVRWRQTQGWLADRLAIRALELDALDSTCRTPAPDRDALLAWLDGQIARRGGPVEEAWLRAGKDLGAVEELLELTRVRLLLASAIGSAPADCPFWIEADEPFRGRQIADDRWQLVVEGGGKGIFLRQTGDLDLSAGGAGRVLIGRSAGRHLAFFTGVELGGGAELRRDAQGERGVVFAFDLVAPAVVRWRLVSSYLELEAGYLAHWTERDDDFVSGLHLGAAFGFKALRQRWFVPGIAIGVAYERTFPADDRPTLEMFKVGLRVTLDFDL